MRAVWSLLVAVSPVIAGLPAAVAGQETNPQPEPKAPQVTPVGHDQRYEGYLFVDTDGHPLPSQSDEDIENYLRTASVMSVAKMPVGITRPRKVLLSVDGFRLNAVFKDIDVTKKNVRDPPRGSHGRFYLTWRDSYEYDLAAYHVDRLLGLDRVPPIVIRKVKSSTGSLQVWLNGTITENDRRKNGYEPPDVARFQGQLQVLRVFDNLVANRDSNLGNTLIDRNWRLWFIDCSRCFGTVPELLFPEAVTNCDRQMWKALQELDRSSAEPVLSPFLERVEIDALFARRDQLVDLIQGLIDRWGEDAVLFDMRPPEAVAPWASED